MIVNCQKVDEKMLPNKFVGNSSVYQDLFAEYEEFYSCFMHVKTGMSRKPTPEVGVQRSRKISLPYHFQS